MNTVKERRWLEYVLDNLIADDGVELLICKRELQTIIEDICFLGRCLLRYLELQPDISTAKEQLSVRLATAPNVEEQALNFGRHATDFRIQAAARQEERIDERPYQPWRELLARDECC